MKILILTVAGLSTRFSESIGEPCLKCIFYRNSIKESLLYRMLHQKEAFDKYVIVGGYMFEQLKTTLENDFTEIQDKIILIKNDRYSDFGSGYSLFLGLQAVMDLDFQEIVFAEGDLYVDSDSFQEVCHAVNNVITYNREPRLANKAVAFYYDSEYRIHYIYDTQHSALRIQEPFIGIFNSGQIWKFVQRDRIRDIVETLTEAEYKKTNLVVIQKYFGSLDREQYDMVELKEWINCNTIIDFDKIPL